MTQQMTETTQTTRIIVPHRKQKTELRDRIDEAIEHADREAVKSAVTQLLALYETQLTEA